jgi:TolB protein
MDALMQNLQKIDEIIGYVLILVLLTSCSTLTSVEPSVEDTLAPMPTHPIREGSQIAFYSSRDGTTEIYVINSDGSDLQKLTVNGGMAPAFSPDGSQIAFTSSRDGDNEIFVMGADGSNQRQLTNNSFYESHPAWSPDGEKLSFVSERDGNREIYVMNVDGTNPQRLTNNSAEDMRPAWSPNGLQIAFNSDRDGNWEIYVLNLESRVLQNLTNDPDWAIFPAWSPDGLQIAYRCSRPNEWNGDICVINVDEGEERILIDHVSNDENPCWSPDGRQIVFQSDRYASQSSGSDNYNFEIFVMDADGSNVRRLTNDPSGDYWPTW